MIAVLEEQAERAETIEQCRVRALALKAGFDAWKPDAKGKVVENDARIDERNAVVGEKGRRLEERVELRELIDAPEQRNWPMYKWSFCDDERNRDPAHVGRIKHSYELHKISSLAGREV